MDEKCAENDFYCSILKEQISLEISEMEIGRSDNGETGGHLTSQFWKFHPIEARIQNSLPLKFWSKSKFGQKSNFLVKLDFWSNIEMLEKSKFDKTKIYFLGPNQNLSKNQKVVKIEV